MFFIALFLVLVSCSDAGKTGSCRASGGKGRPAVGVKTACLRSIFRTIGMGSLAAAGPFPEKVAERPVTGVRWLAGKHKDLFGGLAGGNLERVMGIEPTLFAWEAKVLPLNYTRLKTHYR
jgi:hypothetical protein